MKSIKSSSIKSAKNHALKESKHVFYSGTVLKYHVNKNGKDERILIITDLFISYYTKKGENANTNYWIDLTSFSIQNKEKNIMINLNFDPKEIMRFECPDKSKVDVIIIEAIKHMSTGKNIKIEGCKTSIDFSILPRTIFNFILSDIFRKNNILSKNLKNSIRMICRLHSKIVGFTPNMIEQYFPFLLKSISFSNYIESLRIPELDKTDVFKVLSEYLQKEPIFDSTLFHIGIAKQNMANFSSFCESLLQNKSDISALTFVNSEFDKESLGKLSESINNPESKINSIGFDSAIINDVDFVDSFFPNSTSLEKSKSPIQFLLLSRMKIADVNNFISLLKGIRVLSLSYMNVEVSSIFQAISNAGMDELNFLNISGNFFNGPTNSIKNLPSSLQRLDANEVNFFIEKQGSESGNTLIDFFISVLNKKWKFLLHFSFSHVFTHTKSEGMQQADSSLELLYAKLKKIKTSSCQILKGLSFSGNFVNENFIEFLKKCHNLKSLFINFVLTNESPFLDAFCEVLKNSLQKLSTLSVIGDLNQNKVLGEKFTIICKALKKSKNLNCLIAADNLIGNKGLESLGELIEQINNNKSDHERSKIGHAPSFVFDNCGVDSMQPLIFLAERATSTGKPVLLDYPTTEVWRLKETNGADTEQVRELRKKFEDAFLAGNDREVDSEKVDDDVKCVTDYWKKTFSEYKVPANDFFPEYLSPQLLTEINSPEKANISEQPEKEEEKKKDDVKPKARAGVKPGHSKSGADKEDDKKSQKSKKKNDEENDDKKSSKKKQIESIESEEESDDEEDNVKKKKKAKSKSVKDQKKKLVVSSDSEEEDDDEEESDNVKKKAKAKAKSMKEKKRKRLAVSSDSDDDEEEEDDDDDERRSSRKRNAKARSMKDKKRKRLAVSSGSDDEDEDSRSSRKRTRRRATSVKDQKRRRSVRVSSNDEDDEDSDDSAASLRRSKNRSKRSRRIISSGSDSEEESEEVRGRSRRRTSSKIQKSKKILHSSPSSNGEDDSSSASGGYNNRHSSRRQKMHHRIPKSDSDSDGSGDHWSPRRSGRSARRRRSESSGRMGSSRRSVASDGSDDESGGSFPLSVDADKEKQMIKSIKKKFSIWRLQEEIISKY